MTIVEAHPLVLDQIQQTAQETMAAEAEQAQKDAANSEQVLELYAFMGDQANAVQDVVALLNTEALDPKKTQYQRPSISDKNYGDPFRHEAIKRERAFGGGIINGEHYSSVVEVRASKLLGIGELDVDAEDGKTHGFVEFFVEEDLTVEKLPRRLRDVHKLKSRHQALKAARESDSTNTPASFQRTGNVRRIGARLFMGSPSREDLKEVRVFDITTLMPVERKAIRKTVDLEIAFDKAHQAMDEALDKFNADPSDENREALAHMGSELNSKRQARSEALQEPIIYKRLTETEYDDEGSPIMTSLGDYDKLEVVESFIGAVLETHPSLNRNQAAPAETTEPEEPQAIEALLVEDPEEVIHEGEVSPLSIAARGVMGRINERLAKRAGNKADLRNHTSRLYHEVADVTEQILNGNDDAELTMLPMSKKDHAVVDRLIGNYRRIFDAGGKIPPELREQIEKEIEQLRKSDVHGSAAKKRQQELRRSDKAQSHRAKQAKLKNETRPTNLAGHI